MEKVTLVNPVRMAELLAGEWALRRAFGQNKAVSVSRKDDVFVSSTGVLRVTGPRLVLLDPGPLLRAVSRADTVEFYPRGDGKVVMVATYEKIALPLRWKGDF